MQQLFTKAGKVGRKKKEKKKKKNKKNQSPEEDFSNWKVRDNVCSQSHQRAPFIPYGAGVELMQSAGYLLRLPNTNISLELKLRGIQ